MMTNEKIVHSKNTAQRKPPGLRLKGLAPFLAHRLGIYIDHFPPVDSMEKHLQATLEELEINCVFDVGGHWGEYGSKLRELGYQGQIISFEPLTDSFQILNQACSKDDQWQAHQIALGEAEEMLEINVFNSTDFNSLLQPSENMRKIFGTGVERTEIIQVKRLDTLMQQCLAGIANPRVYLKVDTQGYDLKVIRGIGDQLKQILALQLELSVTPLYEGMPNFSEAVNFLEQLQFLPTGFFPVCRSEYFHRITEFDGFFERQ